MGLGSRTHAAVSSSREYGPAAGGSLNSASRSALDSCGRSIASSAMHAWMWRETNDIRYMWATSQARKEAGSGVEIRAAGTRR